MERIQFPRSISHHASAAVLALFFLIGAQAQADSELAPQMSAKVDQIVQQALAATGVPSASVAVVKDGQIAYVRAYGQARLDPSTPARPEMRYSIGSISKQFTAAAILMLAERTREAAKDTPRVFESRRARKGG